MARISLLFSLALVLAIGSVSAHPPSQKETQKIISPSTLADLQPFSSVEVYNHIKEAAHSGPNTIQFKTLLSICKIYNNHLAAFKFGVVEDVVGAVHAEFTSVTKSMLAAQSFVGVKGELAVTLRKSYTTMAQGYIKTVEEIAEISANYKFNADAKISESDKAKIDKCLITLKDSISDYVKVISQCSQTFSTENTTGFAIGHRGYIGTFAKPGGAKAGGQ